ncbi:MAG: cellulase family glycosylhydrolase [Verrucomicrobia bacterium]|nr:cellulase family glycosylhydrolase [Verrucomicrobiota bacterium]
MKEETGRGLLATFGVLLTLTCAGAPADAPSKSLPKVSLAQETRGFKTERGEPYHPFGVNYFRPGTGWAPQLWKKFDADATRGDFRRMKGLGVNCVRVFLTFGSFYTEPGVLASEGLAKFDQFLALAEEFGIYVHPTGPDHWEGLPGWARGDRIADPKVLDALESFWRLFAARYRGRNAIFAYDLLNEPSVPWDSAPLLEKWNRWLEREYGSKLKVAEAWQSPGLPLEFGKIGIPPPKAAPGDKQLLDFQHFREEIADEWTRRQAAAIKAADPEALVTVGFIQWSVPSLLPSVKQYAAFRPSRQAKYLDFLEIHFYPLAHGAYEYRDSEEEQMNLAYLEAVTREVAKPDKPVVVAEFGWYGGAKPTFDNGRHPAATEEQQARWCRKVVETTAGLATGWLNWGLYDHPEARDVSQLTGLLSVEGELKAWGREFQRLSRSLPKLSKTPPRPDPRPVLEWDRFVTNPKAAEQFREDYLRAFRRME